MRLVHSRPATPPLSEWGELRALTDRFVADIRGLADRSKNKRLQKVALGLIAIAEAIENLD